MHSRAVAFMRQDEALGLMTKKDSDFPEKMQGMPQTSLQRLAPSAIADLASSGYGPT